MSERHPAKRGGGLTEPVVVVRGRGRVSPDTPILRADDLGVLRGDGVFETLHVRGEPWLLDAHLARMARSAARLDLDLPDRDALAELAWAACAEWPGEVEGALRLICTRGVESGGPVTVYATLTPISDAVRELRRHGAAVATATLGITTAVRAEAPWLLGGVKALSYAVNMASQRWAGARQLDDVLWVATDGYLLEAPTASLVWLVDGTLCTVPPERTGVLPGTTARHLLDHAGALGWRAAEQLVRPAELVGTAGAWLTSSVRGAVPIRELDGVALPPSPHTAAIQRLLGHPV